MKKIASLFVSTLIVSAFEVFFIHSDANALFVTRKSNTNFTTGVEQDIVNYEFSLVNINENGMRVLDARASEKEGFFEGAVEDFSKVVSSEVNNSDVRIEFPRDSNNLPKEGSSPVCFLNKDRNIPCNEISKVFLFNGDLRTQLLENSSGRPTIKYSLLKPGNGEVVAEYILDFTNKESSDISFFQKVSLPALLVENNSEAVKSAVNSITYIIENNLLAATQQIEGNPEFRDFRKVVSIGTSEEQIFVPNSVPEPSSILGLFGFLGVGALMVNKRK